MLSKEQAEFVRSFADLNGNIDADILTDAARNPNCPIHHKYEWSDAVAAELHRRETSKTIIRFVKLQVIINKTTIVAPHYVVDPNREPRSRKYIDITVAAKEEQVARKILLAEMDRISLAVQRAMAVAAVLGLLDELRVMLQNVETIKTQAQQEKAARGQKRTRKTAA
jgi:hypothetical protein